MQKCLLAICALAIVASAQSLAGLEQGTLPVSWLTGGPNCLVLPDWQVHQYNSGFFIIRESGCINYEKPFLYLIFGEEHALLIDTGAGPIDTAAFIKKLIAKWSLANKKTLVGLIVVHSHAHGDHVSGDKEFDGLAATTLIPATVEAQQKAFGIANWPEQTGRIDLGDRVIDVIAIPGHQPAHVAYYDRKTGILLTGDHLYPGRLYVTDFPAYLASTHRLLQFTADKPVAHILGCHIEQTTTPFLDYPIGTVYQPQEHELSLGRSHLLELLDGLEQMKGKPSKLALRDFTIFPREPRPDQKKK